MATVSFSRSLIAFSPFKPHTHHSFPFTLRAATGDSPSGAEEAKSQATSEPEDFDSRLSRFRIRYRTGVGKKAERRKARQGKTRGSEPGSGIYLPPVPLQEPASEGLNVEFGFTRYSERANGRIAILGLFALLMVELATGQAVVKYHTPAVVVLQVYSVAATASVYAKYEKERVSVWPSSPPSEE